MNVIYPSQCGHELPQDQPDVGLLCSGYAEPEIRLLTACLCQMQLFGSKLRNQDHLFSQLPRFARMPLEDELANQMLKEVCQMCAGRSSLPGRMIARIGRD